MWAYAPHLLANASLKIFSLDELIISIEFSKDIRLKDVIKLRIEDKDVFKRIENTTRLSLKK